MTNNFNLDPSCVLWNKFSDGSLTLDYSGKGNHLTNVGVTYLDGAKFVRAEGDYLYRANADLGAGFPGTADDDNLAFLIKFKLANITYDHYIVSKWGGDTGFILYFVPGETYHQLVVAIGQGDEDVVYPRFEWLVAESPIAADTNYVFGFSFNAATGAYLLKLYNADTAALLDSAFDTTLQGMTANTVPFMVGGFNATALFDGTIHALAIFNTPKTEADFDAMAEGVYGTTSYKFEVDWDGDSSWDHAESDITSDVLQASWSHGRGSDTDYDNAGSLSLTLVNGTGKYNSAYSSSPIYGLIKPNRKIRASMIVSGTSVTMWQGFLNQIMPMIGNPASTSTAQLTAFGPIAQLTDTKATTALHETITTGAAIDELLDGVSWPAGDMALDTGLTTIPKWWIKEATTRLSAIREMQDMEFGRFREGKDGKLVFDDRDAIFDTPHDTAQSTYGTGTLAFKSIQQIDSRSGIYNAVRARCRVYGITPEVALATVIDIDAGIGSTPLTIPAGGSRTIDISLPTDSSYSSVYQWTDCAYTANAAADGSGADLTASVSTVESSVGPLFRVVFSNAAASPAHLTRIVGKGYGIANNDTLTVSASDATSQAVYDERIYSRIGNWFIDPNHAQAHADHAIALFKNPRPRLQFTVAPIDGNHALEIQAREIGDRIHIETGADTGLYIDADYIIDSISHSVAPDKLHIMTVTCTQAPTAELAASGGAYTFRYVPTTSYDPATLSTYDSSQPGAISSLVLNVDEGMMWFSCARPTTNYKSITHLCVSLATGATHHGPYAAQRAAYAADVLATDTGLSVVAGKLTYAIASGTPNAFKGKVLLIWKSGDTGLDAHVIASDSGTAIVMSSAFFSSGTYSYAVVQPYYTLNTKDYVFEWPADFNNLDIEDSTWRTKKMPIQVGTWYAQGYALNRYGVSSSIATSAQTAVAHVRTGATYRTTATANRGIRLDSGYLRVYDNAGNEKLSANASTGAISVTGAITAGAGSNINTSYLDGSIGIANLDIANRGWVQTCAFTVTDADTVSWGAGTFTAADGTAYSINAGNTGNMSAKNYIYLDTAVSTTAYQKTTTAATAVGAGKVLIAIAQNGTGEATFMVMGGMGAKNIDASEIVAGSITANEIAASTITTGKLAATAIDSMTITGATIRTAASGAGIYLDSTNGLQAKDSSGNVLTQIGLTGVTTIKTGTGSERIEFDASNGLTAYYGSAIKTQIGLNGKIYANELYVSSSGPAGSSEVSCLLLPSATIPTFGVSLNGTSRLSVNVSGIIVNGKVSGSICPRTLQVTDADPAVYTDLTDGELVIWENTDHSVFGIAIRVGTLLKAVTLS
jgi:hypothetical protein